jgi:hypothetical protein
MSTRPSPRQFDPYLRREVISGPSCGIHVLCYGEFSAKGATLDQVKAIFAEAGIAVICIGDVEGM